MIKQIKGLKVTLEVAKPGECKHPSSYGLDAHRYTLKVNIPETYLAVQEMLDPDMQRFCAIPEDYILEKMCTQIAATVKANIRAELTKAMQMGAHRTYHN